MQLPIYFFGDNHFSPTPSSSNEQKIRKLEQFIDVIENSGGSISVSYTHLTLPTIVRV